MFYKLWRLSVIFYDQSTYSNIIVEPTKVSVLVFILTDTSGFERTENAVAACIREVLKPLLHIGSNNFVKRATTSYSCWIHLCFWRALAKTFLPTTIFNLFSIKSRDANIANAEYE